MALDVDESAAATMEERDDRRLVEHNCTWLIKGATKKGTEEGAMKKGTEEGSR